MKHKPPDSKPTAGASDTRTQRRPLDVKTLFPLVEGLLDFGTSKRILENFISFHGENKKEIALIKQAFKFGAEKHKGQKREDGSEYFIHPVSVALKVSEIGGSCAQICAALLHDVMEDQNVSFEELVNEFGLEIATLVVQLSKPRYTGTEWIFADHPNYHKLKDSSSIFLREYATNWLALESVKEASEEQLREGKRVYYETRCEVYYESLLNSDAIDALVIKVFDNLHNVKTLQYLDEATREKNLGTIKKYTLSVVRRLDPSLYNEFAEEFRKWGYGVPSAKPVLLERVTPLITLPPRRYLKWAKPSTLPVPSVAISVYAEANFLLATDGLKIGLPILSPDSRYLSKLREYFPEKKISPVPSLLPRGMRGSEQIFRVRLFRPGEARAWLRLQQGDVVTFKLDAVRNFEELESKGKAAVDRDNGLVHVHLDYVRKVVFEEPVKSFRKQTLAAYTEFAERLETFFAEVVRPLASQPVQGRLFPE